jgi:hypothetical protein
VLAVVVTIGLVEYGRLALHAPLPPARAADRGVDAHAAPPREQRVQLAEPAKSSPREGERATTRDAPASDFVATVESLPRLAPPPPITMSDIQPPAIEMRPLASEPLAMEPLTSAD